MKDVFGIDLGTTNSCIAIVGDNGLPEVVKNLEDAFTTPSVVYYSDDGSQYAGAEAKNMMGGDISRTVSFIKREMSNKNYVRNIDGEKVTPISASALILKKVVDDANQQREYEGLPPIHKAVITVPAYFGSEERERTKQAGQIAGLEVLDLLNEPTAAALSYGTKGLEGKTFLIYDLGGGTFDVSIMRMSGGELTTISTDGDHHLGGVDWDIRLIDHVLQKNGLDVTYEDIKEEREVGKLLISAELCKKNLSRSEKAVLKFVYKRKQYFTEVSRSVFEELTEDLLDNTIDIIEHAKQIATEDVSHIDEIILVGGSSYMPMVKERLTREYPGCKIRLDNLEPDRAVAKGAAVHAANLTGETSTRVKLGSDMSSRSYGTDCMDAEGNIMVCNLILRTDPMIYSGCDTFTTHADNQEAVSFKVFENTSVDKYVDPRFCTLLQDKSLRWGSPVPKGTEITSWIERNQDGTIHIVAECQGEKLHIDIKPEGILSEKEVARERDRLRDKHV